MSLISLEEIAIALDRSTWGGPRAFWAITPEGYIEGNLINQAELAEWSNQLTDETESPGDAASIRISMDESAKATAESLSDVESGREDEFILLALMDIRAHGLRWERLWGHVRTSSINAWGFGERADLIETID